MRDRGEEARTFFLSGYNCSQSVVMAYRDFFPESSFSAILSSSSSFGGGMGRLREVCGTVSGALFVLGTVFGYSNPSDNGKKALLYTKIQEFASLFEEKNGSIICRDLLGLKGKSSPIPEVRSAAYYQKRPCPGICYSSASLLQSFLEKEGILDENGEIVK